MKPITVMETCGGALPKQIVSNQGLAAGGLETSDQWITQRTGIKQRHIAQGDEESTGALAIQAAKQALEAANMDGRDLDMIIAATCTADYFFPSIATQVQGALGMKKGFAFDINAACSGFIYGLNVADNFFRAGQAKSALVIGADTLTRLIDWDDRSTAVLFGDGAGAVVLRQANGKDDGRGILASKISSDGEYLPILYAKGGAGVDQKNKGTIYMEGPEVFRHAVGKISEAIIDVIAQSDFTKDDIDWFIPHQANKRILDSVARRVGLSEDKVIITICDHANTSAASVPLALAQGCADGRVKRGDLILMEAMGGGLTWGATLARW